ncbi:MAG TPA: chemotaxis protein CheB [Polyangiaceae bacterium]|nr:chemotaxis protein CheB [Polyangiaceae bacterium]
MAVEFAPQQVEAVAIGASAGGVEALSAVLPALNRSCRVPTFVVVHVPRERPSLLSQLFASKCSLAVVEALDKQPIEPGVIYFAPPDYHLLVDGDHLALSIDDLVHYCRPAVDVLFQSAADRYGPGLLALVLSGANQDGAAGLKYVAAAGGQTLVQRPDCAVAPQMPQAALAAVPDSLALDLKELAATLSALNIDTETKVRP